VLIVSCDQQSHFEERCDNPEVGRFAFWGVTTTDWLTFSDPERVVDPHCLASAYSPMTYGDGGIDGNMVREHLTL
jgi:hypothetical protein